MTMTMDLQTERNPLGKPLADAEGSAVRPFGLSVTRWQQNMKHERDEVILDPDSQIGYFGDRPVRDLITAATTCSLESDGKDVISLDWTTDDGRQVKPRSGPSPRVLVLTEICDPTADFVLGHLNERGVGFWRLDPGDFPDSLDLSAGFDGSWFGELLGPLRLAELSEIRAVYYRRPSGFKTPAGLSEAEAAFVRSQARHALFGVLAALPGVTWLNAPGRMADARVKPYQLAIAANVGFVTPRTLVTTLPDDVVAFGRRVGRVVTKSLSTVLYEDPHEGSGLLYTAEVPESDWGHPGVGATAHLFQEVVEREYEVRLTYVDGQCFGAAIVPDNPEGELDIRAHQRAVSYAATPVPAEIETAVKEMMDRLGLLFGAFDFIVRPDGQWVFIELNPNGQWAWIEQETGLPVSAALADILEKGAVG